MITVDRSKIVRQGVPPAFRERCVIRVTDKKFGPNKKDNPMITINWEMVGYFDQNNVLQSTIKRGDTTYKLDGLRLSQPTWLTLTPEQIQYYVEFYEKANPGQKLTELDETNPDLTYLDTLMMQAIIEGEMIPQRRQITDEEKQALIAAGKEPIGDVLLDDEGKPIENASLKIAYKGLLKAYSGDLPEGVAPY